MMPRPLIDEWGPLWRNGTFYQMAVFALSLALLAYTVRHVGIRAFRGLPVILICALFAAKSARLLSFYAIAWICYLPAYLQATPLGQGLRRRYEARAWPLLAVWGAMLAVYLPSIFVTRPWLLRIPDRPIPKFGTHVIYPVGAVDYLASTGFRGNLMVPFDWGAYVSWRLYPEVKVSIDSRYEVAYPPGSLEENSVFYRAQEGWQQILAIRPAAAVLVPTALPVSREMPTVPGWKQAYRDDHAEVYVRSRGEGRRGDAEIGRRGEERRGDAEMGRRGEERRGDAEIGRRGEGRRGEDRWRESAEQRRGPRASLEFVVDAPSEPGRVGPANRGD
jgi:hypothetical protein